jgi:hypothetical protein
VTTVVPLGSPIVQNAPGSSARYKILHFEAYKDPVIDWGHPGKRDAARRAGVLYETTTATGNNFWANVNGLGVVAQHKPSVVVPASCDHLAAVADRDGPVIVATPCRRAGWCAVREDGVRAGVADRDGEVVVAEPGERAGAVAD